MSPGESILERILHSLKKVKIEAILVGNAASALQGVPVMTQDIDFFIRDTQLNRKKIERFAKDLDLSILRMNKTVSETIRAENEIMIVDFVFTIGHGQSFESVRARSRRIRVGRRYARVASLEDILKFKKALGRDKDKAVLKLIEDTIKVRKMLGK